MKIPNLYALCNLGQRLANFEPTLHANMTVLDMAAEYLELTHVLRHIEADESLALPVSKKHAISLLEFLDSKVKNSEGEFKIREVFDESDIFTIKETLTRFTHALSDELPDMPL